MISPTISITKMTNGTGPTTSNNNTTNKLKSTNKNDDKEWCIKASDGALSTINPIRAIIETVNLSPNKDKQFIPLSIGNSTDYTLLNFKIYLFFLKVYR